MVEAMNETILSEDIQGTNITCRPSENWNVLIHKNNIIKNVCISKNYNAEQEPNQERPTHLDIMLPNIKIVHVAERKKRILVDITAVSFWEDNRIRTMNSNDDRAIPLPSILKGDDSPVIWNPFRSVRISKLKRLQYALDPTMIDIALVPKYLVQSFLKSHITSANKYLIASRVDWSILVACVFDFSEFPFDTNVCKLEMKFLNLNVTLHSHIHGTSMQKDRKHTSEGFKITIVPLQRETEFDPLFGSDMIKIAFDITLDRQLSKYVYQYYIPCISIVTASSFSFIIPISAIPGRVALVVTQFLTLTNIFSNQMVFYHSLLSFHN